VASGHQQRAGPKPDGSGDISAKRTDSNAGTLRPGKQVRIDAETLEYFGRPDPR
jgi:hypothetical protein